MNNIEIKEDMNNKFNIFLNSINLYVENQYLVDFDVNSVNDSETLSGDLLLPFKTIESILIKSLKQKPKKRKTYYGTNVSSFKIKNKGWLILESSDVYQFSRFGFLILVNKWW